MLSKRRVTTRSARPCFGTWKRCATPPIAPSDNTTWLIPPIVWWRQSWERRWNRALTRVSEMETRIAAHDRAAPPRSELSAASFVTLADDLQTVWQAPTTDARLKKRIVRAVIKEVVADVDAEAGEIILFLHWMGGIHTELRLPRRRRGQRDSTSQDIVTAVRQLVSIANDELIAGILNRNKLTTGRGNRWTRERVTALRSHHKIPVYCPAEQGQEPWLNLSKAAAYLQISSKTLRLAAEGGEIDALHPLPDGPWILSSAILDSTAAKALVHRARNRAKHPSGPHPDQQNLFSSMA